jgi:malonyl-CoA O-methyltransferase
MNKKALARNFSKSALFYDQYADVQRKSARALVHRLNRRRFGKILDVGCGTGIYALLLREKFVGARLMALDISEKMVAVAQDKCRGKKIDFLVADGECFDQKEKFDLITSNACFQWFEDLESALIRYKRMLSKEGVISFSIFGPLTFQELNASLKSVFQDAHVPAACFIDREKLTSLLKVHFKNIRVDEIIYEEEFASLNDFLKKIKYTGTSGSGLRRDVFFGSKKLAALEAQYRHQFKQIKATNQVFFCKGVNA